MYWTRRKRSRERRKLVASWHCIRLSIKLVNSIVRSSPYRDHGTDRSTSIAYNSSSQISLKLFPLSPRSSTASPVHSNKCFRITRIGSLTTSRSSDNQGPVEGRIRCTGHKTIEWDCLSRESAASTCPWNPCRACCDLWTALWSPCRSDSTG